MHPIIIPSLRNKIQFLVVSKCVFDKLEKPLCGETDNTLFYASKKKMVHAEA
jgi:hypothetical protein